jgi:hypothetical protein
LYDKIKADLLLTITANNLSNNLMWTLKQTFVVTTSGGIKFSGEQFTNTISKRLYYPTGGY